MKSYGKDPSFPGEENFFFEVSTIEWLNQTRQDSDQPTRSPHHQIIWITKGTGTFCIDMEKYRIADFNKVSILSLTSDCEELQNLLLALIRERDIRHPKLPDRGCKKSYREFSQLPHSATYGAGSQTSRDVFRRKYERHRLYPRFRRPVTLQQVL